MKNGLAEHEIAGALFTKLCYILKEIAKQEANSYHAIKGLVEAHEIFSQNPQKHIELSIKKTDLSIIKLTSEIESKGLTQINEQLNLFMIPYIAMQATTLKTLIADIENVTELNAESVKKLIFNLTNYYCRRNYLELIKFISVAAVNTSKLNKYINDECQVTGFNLVRDTFKISFSVEFESHAFGPVQKGPKLQLLGRRLFQHLEKMRININKFSFDRATIFPCIELAKFIQSAGKFQTDILEASQLYLFEYNKSQANITAIIKQLERQLGPYMKKYKALEKEIKVTEKKLTKCKEKIEKLYHKASKNGNGQGSSTNLYSSNKSKVELEAELKHKRKHKLNLQRMMKSISRNIKTMSQRILPPIPRDMERDFGVLLNLARNTHQNISEILGVKNSKKLRPTLPLAPKPTIQSGIRKSKGSRQPSGSLMNALFVDNDALGQRKKNKPVRIRSATLSPLKVLKRKPPMLPPRHIASRTTRHTSLPRSSIASTSRASATSTTSSTTRNRSSSVANRIQFFERHESNKQQAANKKTVKRQPSPKF